MDKIAIYSVGLCSMSICAEVGVSIEEIENMANTHCLTGIESKWKVAWGENFADGKPMPSICDTEKFRLHWLLHC